MRSLRAAFPTLRPSMAEAPDDATVIADDERALHRLGYAQELARRMSGFSNFALSLSIICILAGGVTSFHLGFCSVGGASIGLGWPLVGLFALAVAATMGQLASTFPTAGGLYHWSSILGGRGWGWATAWFNLLGLIFVVSSVDVGVWILFQNMILKGLFGVDTTALADTTIGGYGYFIQAIAVIVIVGSQAIFNHIGIRATTILTDFSGYLIFVWWSLLFGYVMICSFVLAMPSVADGAKQGGNVFYWLMDGSSMPAALKAILYIGIVLANYLCALAGLTSLSRMIFAFARDG